MRSAEDDLQFSGIVVISHPVLTACHGFGFPNVSVRGFEKSSAW